VITLGGSGHEPALSGFVGDGMLDCSVVGDIFAAPGAQRLFQALQMFKREAGILLVVLNHSGDIMSANMACQLAERTGIKVKIILMPMNISAGLDAPDEDRRGLAGCVPLISPSGRSEMVMPFCGWVQDFIATANVAKRALKRSPISIISSNDLPSSAAAPTILIKGTQPATFRTVKLKSEWGSMEKVVAVASNGFCR